MSLKKKKPDGYHAPAVEKAFRLLRFVANSNEALRLSDLSAHLQISKSTTHGLIRALVATGALNQSTQNKKITLGPATVELALKNQNYLQLGTLTQPLLDDLRDRINETVFFGLLHPWRALIMATSEARKPMKISSPPGSSVLLMVGALGKVFLSQMDDAEVLQIIKENGLPQFTNASIIDEQTYLKEIAYVRQTGYALDKGEYLSGVNAIAVGLGHHCELPVVLWVVGFAESLNSEKIDEVKELILATATKLRKVLHTN
ncbi:MAG: IclR family transcriptional regulator [Desulfobacterales bacterium]|nr:IclR family transcriptional regulator [Desulfobacterales bacterium]MDJ0912214.1 IclR family transcriptional regulator [Desulfobacterales bacterium]